MPQNATPTEGKDRAALTLAAGGSVTEAAELAGVDRSTVHRWLKLDSEFSGSIRDLRRRAFDAAVGVLSFEAEAAARHLVSLATGQHDNGPVRLGAIRSLFQITSDHFTVADLEERMAAIEARLETRRSA